MDVIFTEPEPFFPLSLFQGELVMNELENLKLITPDAPCMEQTPTSIMTPKHILQLTQSTQSRQITPSLILNIIFNLLTMSILSEGHFNLGIIRNMHTSNQQTVLPCCRIL